MDRFGFVVVLRFVELRLCLSFLKLRFLSVVLVCI